MKDRKILTKWGIYFASNGFLFTTWAILYHFVYKSQAAHEASLASSNVFISLVAHYPQISLSLIRSLFWASAFVGLGFILGIIIRKVKAAIKNKAEEVEVMTAEISAVQKQVGEKIINSRKKKEEE